MPDLRPTIFLLGVLLIAVAIGMLLPAAIDLADRDRNWQSFLVSAAITGGVGGAMVLGFRANRPPAISPREGFILTTFAWIIVAGFATLPLMLSERRLDFADAYFEAMSGLTTTGSTVLMGLNQSPRGLLLWRSLLQMMGGVGIIVIAVAILPMLRVGGMQLFRMESSDKSEKVRPRVQEVCWLIIKVYFVLLVLCIIALMLAGMSWFDAVCHSMTTISTGGFGTKDASIGYYRSPSIEWLLTLFMLLGGTTFVLMTRLGHGDVASLWRDQQTRWYVGYLVGFVAIIAAWQVVVSGRPAMEAIRASAFNVVSIATTTGFASEDYTLWGSLPVAGIMALLFIGGCTGSTSGGIKVFRFCVLGSIAMAQIRHLVHPNRMLLPTYNGRPISEDVTRSVMSFFFFYIGSFAVLSVAISAFGLDLVTAMSGVGQALANVGPGLGPIIGPAGNYAALDDGAKWILSFAMMLGRLELLTVLVLLSPTFWRG